MRKSSNSRLLPVVLAPAVMPAILLPLMLANHVSDNVIGGTLGFFIGLAVVALAWMAKGGSRCAPGNS
ncbi:MAG: hypothetical protein QOE79_1518 [Sphingomonadales bacterium]|jgi:hypothetical protein|nr:hypothetical protein [Sphingomonadales bacterium]